MSQSVKLLLFVLLLGGWIFPLFAQQDAQQKNSTTNPTASSSSLDSLALEQLLNQNVALYRESDTASGVQETIKDAPSTLVVITKEDIRRRGYLSLDQVMQDLPGFDVINTYGTATQTSYQRGYRTPFTQRTLLLINGKVDNNLWGQTASISKQYAMLAIERIEVLYGPAGAVYGPNAFLGVINIITQDPRLLKDGESYSNAQLQLGEYATRVIDFTAAGQWQQIGAVLSGRFYQSNGIDISDFAEWGFTDPSLLRDPQVWGQAIAESDFDQNGSKDTFAGNYLGQYKDPSLDKSVQLALSYQQWKFEAWYWRTNEAYGVYYPFDKAQPNVYWSGDSSQYTLEHQAQFEQLKLNTELNYRQSSIFGYWAENFDGWVSLSNWSNFNRAWRVRQQYQYQVSSQWQLSGGVKYEVKQLTKAYTLCGYWAGSLCPVEGGLSAGASVRAPDDRTTITLPPDLARHSFNPLSKITTQDVGAFAQAIYHQEKWRLNLGLRWDHNSEYGGVFNPRIAAIYHFNPKLSYKLSYGEAFQEPSAKDLYGGWNGRAANPTLVPETLKHLEFITTYQQDNALHELSLYRTEYQNVIVNGSEGNVGGRDIWGLEYRGQWYLHNPFASQEDITVHGYYTYTHALADFQYIQGYQDDGSSSWVEKRDLLGDIAPHKVNVIVHWPLNPQWSVNMQLRWVSKRTLYSENPLRAEYNVFREAENDVKTASYFVADINLLYRAEQFDLGLKIENLFGKNYYLPGVEAADSGDDFSQASKGFYNSLIPQPNKPIFTAYLTLRF